MTTGFLNFVTDVLKKEDDLEGSAETWRTESTGLYRINS